MKSPTRLRDRRVGWSIRRIVKSVCAAAATIASSVVLAEPDFTAIGIYIESQRIEESIPGLAVAIVGGDGTVYVTGFGVADAYGNPVASNTPFILGSTSKSFTALAVMQLVEAGRVDLDAPVQRYLPWFRVADEKASAAITVRNLLNQTSGISTAEGRRTLMDFSSGDDALANRVRRLRDVALSAPVGTYQYSNCNYQVLGLIVETVSGQSYDAYMAEHVFAPLDMRNTFTSKEAAKPRGLAMGHGRFFGHTFELDEPLPRASVPQGFIITTTQDMSHYLLAQLNGGRYGEVSVLSADGVAQMHSAAAREGSSDIYYGMGWNVGAIDGIPAVWHGGDTFGFRSGMVLLTDARWGVAILSNVADLPSNGRFEEVVFSTAGLLVGRTPTTAHGRDSMQIHAVVLAICALQVLGMTRSVLLLSRWRREPARSASKSLRLWLPGALNLLWGLLILVALPYGFAPLRVIAWEAPGPGILLLLSAAVALVWAVARTGWLYRQRLRGVAQAAR